MKLQNKFIGLLLPAGLVAGAAVLLLIQRSVHEVIIGGLEQSSVVLARAAAQEAAPGALSGKESDLLPVLQALQRRVGALYAAALDPAGRVLAHTTVSEKGKASSDVPRASAPMVRQTTEHGEPALVIEVPIERASSAPAESFLLSGQSSPRTGPALGALRVAVPLKSAQETESRIIRDISLIVLAIGAIAFALVVALVRGMLKPIRGLMIGIARIGSGQYDVKVPVLSRDELGDLARSFNVMSGELARTTVSKEYVEGVLENMNDLLVVTDSEGRIQTVNHAAVQILGVPASEMIGRPFTSIFLEAKDVTTVLPQGGEGVRDAEVVLRAKDGRGTPALFSSSLLRTRDGRLLGYIGVAKDITDRKRAEDALIKAKVAAEASTRELEAFSYSVAHDLRAPLRSVDGFSQVLLEEYADKLDDTGKDYLRRVRGGSRKMAQLIDDLLNLSRITRSVLRLETVDLSALAADIGAELAKAEPARRVIFTVAPNLSAKGDANLLRVAIVNLLANSWKYTSKHAAARVEFGTEARDGRTVYFVRDDGAGFDMAFSPRLFQPFTRLHPSAEFEGTGIGLATVQRVIARHEGRVWGEGTVEHGAIFHFTLWEGKP